MRVGTRFIWLLAGLAAVVTGAVGVVLPLLPTTPFLLIAAFATMAFAETRIPLMAAMATLGFGMGLAGPGFMAGASLAVSPQEQGAVAGVAGACGPMGFTIGPLVGTALYQLDPQYPYLFTLIVYVPLLVFTLRHART